MLDTQVFLDSPAHHGSVLPAPFDCSWTHDGHQAAWVRLAGELDLATADRLGQTLYDAQMQAQLIVVDMRQVAFADSSAVHAIVNATARARRAGRRLIILRGPPAVDRVFALTGSSAAVETVDLGSFEPPVNVLLRLAAEEADATL